MSDFNDNWQLTGSSDPATPDIQPHQIEQQPAAQPVFQQPVIPQSAQPVFQQPVIPQSAQPVAPQPMYQQPQYGQPVMQGYGYPPQAIAYQNINYAEEREKNLNEITRMINHFSPKVDIYQDYENCKTDIVRYSRSSVAPLVWGIIVVLFGLIPAFGAITANYKDTIIQNAIIAGVLILIGAGLITCSFLKRCITRKRSMLFMKNWVNCQRN